MTLSPKFALIGAAGYIAPRHMAAIKETGGELVAATDPHDSVGILDSFFPDCRFFVEPERFWRFVNKEHIDCVVVCSPNYLHDVHCITAMKSGCHVICEKPISLTERNLDTIRKCERKIGRSVNIILQLRLHPEIEALKPKTGDIVEVDYIAPRGRWYHHSWKGNAEKSGGLATNIGVHLFDLATFLYGKMTDSTLTFSVDDGAAGYLELEHANVRWHLSITQGLKPRRVFTINGKKIDLTNGFEDLHVKSYRKILNGEGFMIKSARESVRICEKIRESTPLFTLGKTPSSETIARYRHSPTYRTMW